MADRQGTPVLNLTGESVACKEDAVRSDSDNSNPHQDESHMKEWKLALKEEVHSIERNNTRNETVLLPGKDAIWCKVVLNRKMDEEGRIARYKARLSGKGLRPERRC